MVWNTSVIALHIVSLSSWSARLTVGNSQMVMEQVTKNPIPNPECPYMCTNEHDLRGKQGFCRRWRHFPSPQTTDDIRASSVHPGPPMYKCIECLQHIHGSPSPSLSSQGSCDVTFRVHYSKYLHILYEIISVMMVTGQINTLDEGATMFFNLTEYRGFEQPCSILLGVVVLLLHDAGDEVRVLGPLALSQNGVSAKVALPPYPPNAAPCCDIKSLGRQTLPSPNLIPSMPIEFGRLFRSSRRHSSQKESSSQRAPSMQCAAT
ncbi:hypothetical protein EDD15DRAFT_2194580 [Pisolithus albus]|nr:hypothetical protein EDD15DRAFT_2194580 [Pisolithus albus]